VLRCQKKESGGIHMELRALHIHRKKMIQILRIGLPAGFQGVVFALSNVVIQSSVNIFGNIVVAGNSAAANLEGFVYMAMNAFYQTTLSFVSQNYGAGEQKRIHRIVLLGEACVIVTGTLLEMRLYFRKRIASHLLQQSGSHCRGNRASALYLYGLRFAALWTLWWSTAWYRIFCYADDRFHCGRVCCVWCGWRRCFRFRNITESKRFICPIRSRGY
ncbi:MAG: MATE family efflux transporter, partial [Ruminococcus callidus]